MATRTWMHGLWLGLVGFSVATGCVVKSGDDDDDDVGGGAGEAGDSSTGGSSTGGKGGSSGSSTGGKGGTSTGGTSTGGTSTGGTSTGGTSTGGTGGQNTDPVCDDDEPMSTPYPDCEPRDTDDDCEVCVQENCCEESRICYGFNPGNVCGWGGPASGPYMGASEWDCYRFCSEDYVIDNGVYDPDAADFDCVNECVTTQCGTIIGNATQDLVVCANMNCEDECYNTPES